MGFPTSCRKEPFKHQIVGVEKLVEWDNFAEGRKCGGCFALFDEMGAGKTKQTIDAACELFVHGEIDRVIVVAPAPVRSVWVDRDPQIGEIAKHAWEGIPIEVVEYRSGKSYRWFRPASGEPRKMLWIVTNYEFIRVENRLGPLLNESSNTTLVIFDESIAIKNPKAKQTRASLKLRRNCGRVIILNGTPQTQGPGDLFSQMFILDPRILGCKDWFHFRSRYAIMGGYMNKEIIAWRDLEEIQQKIKPYVLRRLKKDCMDLPPKLPPTTLEVTLSPETWKIYKQMKEELVAWLKDQHVGIASQAGVKVMRLSQITSGYLGGVVKEIPCDCEGQNRECGQCGGTGLQQIPTEPKHVGSEKLDAFMVWVQERLAEDPELKLIVWCRFQEEAKRVFHALDELHYFQAELLIGGQTKADRERAVRLLKPGFAPKGPAGIVGTPATGALGLDFSAAHTMIYLSNDTDLKIRLQSEDRPHRTGQLYPISYTDMMARGPGGQKTVDHIILKSLRDKEDLAKWTCQAWVTALEEE